MQALLTPVLKDALCASVAMRAAVFKRIEAHLRAAARPKFGEHQWAERVYLMQSEAQVRGARCVRQSVQPAACAPQTRESVCGCDLCVLSKCLRSCV